LIVQVVQPTGSSAGAKWAFVPFRTLAEALWGNDRFRFDGFWNTPHPDGTPLFTSLDGSVTPPIPPSAIGPAPIPPSPIGASPIAREPIAPSPIMEPAIGQPAITPSPTPQPPVPEPLIAQPIRAQPLDLVGTPLLALDPAALAARLARGRPLPFFDGVVRRAGPAGPGGWLTVLAEDEILGLYLSFQDLLPRAARRYHLRHATTALGAVIDNQIVIGDVTETALQFDLGSVT
jgi:hypothetical protein